MKLMARIAMIMGIAATIWMIISEGIRPIVSLLSHALWLLLLLVPFHALPLLLDVLGWRELLGRTMPVRSLLLIASLREAINRLLPVAGVGGEVAGVHLLVRGGVPVDLAAASVIVEVALTLVAQALFAAAGVIELLRFETGVAGQPSIGVALAALGLIPATFYWLLRSGLLSRGAKRIASRLIDLEGNFSALSDQWEALDRSIGALIRSHVRSLRVVAWQLAGLVCGCFETWVVLRWLGHAVSFEAAIALESLSLALRTLAFMVPSGLGIQEASLLGIGHLLGIGGELAVTLSLIKRLREFAYGLSAFAIWHWWEERGAPARSWRGVCLRVGAKDE